MFLRNADAFRYWRWAEQWKTTPGAIDAIWAYPFLSSAFELYAAPMEPIPAPGIYHGLVTVRANIVGHMYVCVVSEVKRSHSHVVVAGIEQRVSVTSHGKDIVKHQAIYGIGIIDLHDAHGGTGRRLFHAPSSSSPPPSRARCQPECTSSPGASPLRRSNCTSSCGRGSLEMVFLSRLRPKSVGKITRILKTRLLFWKLGYAVYVDHVKRHRV